MIDLRATTHAQYPEVGHDHWINSEIDDNAFVDARLARRARVLLGQLAQALGQRIALICQDWTNIKAAYRFLSNERVNEADILTGHFKATQERIVAFCDGPVLMLHDTTEFSWKRASPQAIGVLGRAHSRRDSDGRVRLLPHGAKQKRYPAMMLTPLCQTRCYGCLPFLKGKKLER